MKMPSTRLLLRSSTLLAFGSACSAKASEPCFPPANSTADSIEWKKCPTSLPSKLQCATFSVPIDWDEPYGDHFDLGLVKLPAVPSNSTPKVGYLFVNPGGPGGSATEIVAGAAAGLLKADPLFASFDLIGLDPRGVGMSHQIKCDPKIYAERVSFWPKTQEQFDALTDKNRRLGESCRNLTGSLLEHVDTISVVKDHEAIRVALGNVPFNFLGLSYGTQIGAQYAALFPDNVRTLALDGLVQHSQSEAANILIDSSAYTVGLKSFFKWASENETSVLKGQDVEQLWMNLLANATETPIPAAGCNGTLCSTDVTGEEILLRAQGLMTFKDGGFGLDVSWRSFASGLFNATQGDATIFSPLFADNPSVTMHSVTCLDWTNTPTLAASMQKQDMGASFTPLVNGSSQSWTYQHQCMGWPISLKNPPKALDVKTNATALLVHSDRDPSTGYPWALGMPKEIENSVLVTRLGDGHTSFTLGGQAAGVILKYLITGKVPEDGMTVIS